MDIPYHGPPPAGEDRDSLQSDELSIPDWTTPSSPPLPQPPARSTHRDKEAAVVAAKKRAKSTNRSFQTPLEVEIPYHPPLEVEIPYHPPLDEDLAGNVMVEIPSHILGDDDDIDDDDAEEDGVEVEMDDELARVSPSRLRLF